MKNKFLILLTLLIVFFIFSLPVLANSTCPWELNEREKLLTGFLTKVEANNIYVQTSQDQKKLELLSDPTVAIMGTHSGYLLPLNKFPYNIKTDFFITSENKVRAIRNHFEPFKEVPGSHLEGFGHNAQLSPNERYYLLFNNQTGLFLYSIDNSFTPTNLSSSSSIAAWDSTAEKVAYISQNTLGIYNINKKEKTQHTLYINNKSISDSVKDTNITFDEIQTIFTNLSWNPQGKYLLCTALQDNPNIGSNVFQNIIVNDEGQIVAKKTFNNQSKALWLSADSILFIILSDPEGTCSKGVLWNIKTNTSTDFLPLNKNGYHNVVYNRNNKTLAYTTTRDIGEDLYFINILNGNRNNIHSFITPIRNLQWSTDGTLFFWDEFNNTINQVYWTVPAHKDPIITPKAAGYLPEHAVSKTFIYFLAEPFEEPLQPFLP